MQLMETKARVRLDREVVVSLKAEAKAKGVNLETLLARAFGFEKPKTEKIQLSEAEWDLAYQDALVERGPRTRPGRG